MHADSARAPTGAPWGTLPTGASRPSARLALIAGAILYTLFVVYGCLVPFHYTPLPWSVAWARFEHIPHLRPGPAYDSDWIANVLLFSLCAFLWSGATWPGRRGLRAALLSVGVWLATIAFVTSLEYLQIYFPPRNPDLKDVFAGGSGAAIGIAIWWLLAPRILGLLARWAAVRGREGLAGWFLWPYLALLILFDVMPLDLTMSAHDLLGKWQRGGVWLIPFTSLQGSAAKVLYDVGVETLLWLPLAALWVLSGRASRLVGWGATVLVAMGVECLQLFVQSRVSDMTDVVCAAVGAGLGVAIGGWLRSRPPDPEAAALTSAGGRGAAGVVLALVGFFAWTGVLVAGFCYPFDFTFDPQAFDARLRLLVGIPFGIYWMGPEFQAFFSLLRKIVFFAPLGGLLALSCVRVRGAWARRVCAVGSVVLAGLASAFIELLQVFQPDKVPDSTDILAGAVGGALGYAGVTVLRRRLAPAAVPGHASERSPSGIGAEPRHGRSRLPSWILVGSGYAVLAAICLVAASSPMMPYNVREVFLKGPPHLAALVFPFVVFAAFLPPALMARWLEDAEWDRVLRAPLLVLAHATVAWIGVRAVVPLEAIGDIVGAPVLHWPWEWEMLGRFVALFGGISVLLVMGALLAALLCGTAEWGRALLRYLVVAIPLLCVTHFVVVVKADTDNLVELMAGGGSVGSTFWISAWLVSLAAGGAALAMAISRRTHRGTAWLLAVSSLPFGWMSLSLGTAPYIIKYGAMFSAIQFLLSPDRDHYVEGTPLVARYVVAHVVGLAAIALSQAPAWLERRRSRRWARPRGTEGV